jgi:hypothetical protein
MGKQLDNDATFQVRIPFFLTVVDVTHSSPCVTQQRIETAANTPPLQKDEALSDMSPYPHQTRAESTVGSFQDQARRR